VPPDQNAAISEFLRMARVDAKDPNEYRPSIRAKNYSAPTAHPYRVRFDLREPDPVAEQEGDQDHVLFKTTGNTHNRTHRASGGHRTTIPIGPSASPSYPRRCSIPTPSIACGTNPPKWFTSFARRPTNTSWFCWKSQPEVRGSVSAPPIQSRRMNSKRNEMGGIGCSRAIRNLRRRNGASRQGVGGFRPPHSFSPRGRRVRDPA